MMHYRRKVHGKPHGFAGCAPRACCRRVCVGAFLTSGVVCRVLRTGILLSRVYVVGPVVTEPIWKYSTVLGDLCCETPKCTSRGLEDERLIKIRLCCTELCPENPALM